MKFGKGSNCCTSTNQAMDSLSLKNENEQTHAYYKINDSIYEVYLCYDNRFIKF